MADAVVRLRVESSEYDQKLQRATQQLQHMEKEVRRTGATFAYADEEELEFVKSLGSMETKAESAKGKIAEMTKAFTELSLQYKRMTDEEKQSPFGRAMESSLNKLKSRIKESKGDLAGIEGQLGGMGGVAEQLGGKLGLPIGQLAKFGPYGAAAAAAMKVAKDAFFDSESGIDEWGRTVEGAKGAYTIFLDTINNGNWSNFFSNLNAAISGSRQLYDEMDRLGSIKSNNAAAIAKEQATIQELRTRQQKGENVAEELRAAEERLKKLQMESVNQGKTVGKDQMKQALTNSVNSIKGNGGWFRKDTTAKVSEAKIDAAIDDILNNGQAAMDKYAATFKKLQEKGTKTITNYSQTGQAYQTKQFDITTLSAEEQALYKLSKAVTDSESKLQTGISTYTGALQEEASANRESFQAERYAQKSDRKFASAAPKMPVEPVIPEGSAAALQKKLSELNKQWSMATSDEDRSGIQKQIDETQKALDAMKGKIEKLPPIEPELIFSEKGISDLGKQIKDKMSGLEIGSDDYLIAAENLLDFTTFENLMKAATERGVNIDPEWMSSLFEDIKVGAEVDDDSWQALVDNINEKLAEMDLPPITLDVKTGGVEEAQQQVDNLADNVNKAIGVFGQLGGVMEQIDDPGAKVAGIVMGAVAEVAGTFAASLKGTFTPWDWIAAAISGVSTMIATISAIKSATSGGFASGGIIPGNSFSGDNMRGMLPNGDLVGLDAGELILNRAQQGVVAGAMQGNPMSNLKLATEVSGSNLRIVLNNDNRSRGGSRDVYGVH